MSSQYTVTHEPPTLVITRPANTTAYDAGDVFGTAAAGAFEWTNFLPGGTGCTLVAIDASSSSTNTANTGLRIHFFKTNPALGVTDNAALPVLAANASNRLGMVELPAHRTGGAGSNAATSEARAPGVNPITVPNLAGTRSVWIVVETLGARAGVSGEVLTLNARTIRS